MLVRGGSLALGGPAARILVAAFAPGGAGPAIVVAAGARLEMRNIDITLPSVASGGIEVAGRLVLDHSSIMSNGTPGVDVRLGGVARMTTSSIMSFGVPALRNAGETLLAYSSLAGVSASAVHGEAASTTSMTATRLQRYTMFIHLFLDPTGAMCSGTLPTSGGYNHAPNASCSLSQPTDRQADDDSWAEAIPQGVVGCGDSFAVDLYGGPRPGAGASACNIGAL